MLNRVCRSLSLSPVLMLICAVSWSAEFSANMVMTTGGRTVRAKVWVKGTNMRCEFAQGSPRMVFLSQAGKSSVTVIVPEKRMYWAQPDPTAGDILDDSNLVKRASKKVVGTETVSGHVCRKVVYTYHDKSKGTATRWVSTRLNAPVKWAETVGGARTVVEFSSILRRKLPASMFSPPAGFRKFTEKQVAEMVKRDSEKSGPGARQ